jgi:hypothetical protein
MSPPDCGWASDWERQVEYFARALPPADETSLEEHVFGCESCGAVFEAVGRLVGRVAAGGKGALLLSALSPAILDRLKQDGLNIVEQRAAPGGALHLDVPPGVDLMIGHLEADLAGVRTIDLEFDMGRHGLGIERDFPVDSRSEVLLACTLHLMQTDRLPDEATICRMRDAGDRDGRIIAEYRLSFGRRAAGVWPEPRALRSPPIPSLRRVD